MPRVKGGYTTRRRRKAILKLAKGYVGSKRTLYKTANELVMRSLAYSYRDRKVNKRNFRKLWIARINAACKLNEFKYSLLINGLKKAGVLVNRKMLAELAIFEPVTFTDLVNVAKKGLKGEIVAAPAKEAAKAPKTVKKVEIKEEVKPVEPKKEAVKAPKTVKKAEVKEEVKPVEPKKEAVKAVDYSSMTVAELKEIAKQKGISGISAMKKADLIEALSK